MYMARFINPFTDVGFKRIFGQEMSKPLLINFLNNLLVGERVIVDLSFLDKEQPAVYEGDRSLIYDIYCETDDGDKIIVEMQNRLQPNFKQRSIYYAAESIARQGEKGPEWRYDVHPVYLIAFLNFTLADIGAKFRTDIALTDIQSKEQFSDRLRLIYLQLPMFRKEPDECKNDFERWIYVLKNMETLSRLPWAAQNAVFKRLSEISEVSSMSKEERHAYDEGLRKYRDSLNAMLGAVEEGLEQGRAQGHAQGLAEGRAEGRVQGLAEGRAEGLAEGRAERDKEIARKMREMGMSNEQIVLATGLTEEQIAAL